MQLRRHAPVSLTTLNDDCLLLICAQLAIREQFSLLQLGGRLEQLVLRIWQSKYVSEFDWQREESQLKLLSAAEQSQLLECMSRLTRSLLNLSDSDMLLSCLTRRKSKRKRKCKSLHNMLRLSFTECKSSLLRQLPDNANNLAHLQLGNCVDVTPKDISTLLAQLAHLRVFELLPGSICGAKAADLANIEYGQVLQRLKLPGCALRAGSRQIARLQQLRQLTGFLCCHIDADDDKERANAKGALGGGVATATISACLEALSACQIVAMSLQCQLDGSMPRLLAGHLGSLRLQRFAWHSMLMVHYDAQDGCIKWLPQAPQVAPAMLRFIVSQAAGLRELDFTRNVHATPTFLTQLAEQLRRPPSELAVWHDGCPRARMPSEQTDTDAKRNDLAFVHLELKQLAIEKPSS